MTRAAKAQMLVVTVVTALGLWGCAQGGNDGSAEQTQALKNQCAKLEGDYRSVVGVRDRLRQQVAELEADRTKLRKEVDARHALAKERDELVQQVSARTTERDAAQGQLDQVRKGLRSLLGQADAAAPATPASVSSADTGAGGPKS